MYYRLKPKVRSIIVRKYGSVTRFANIFGLHQTTVNSWCLGYRNIKPNHLKKLAEILGVDEESIVLEVQRKNQIDQTLSELYDVIPKLSKENQQNTLHYIRAIMALQPTKNQGEPQ